MDYEEDCESTDLPWLDEPYSEWTLDERLQTPLELVDEAIERDRLRMQQEIDDIHRPRLMRKPYQFSEAGAPGRPGVVSRILRWW
jgi:hypothetical protein